jgi:Sec-independent protein translocase protein TatA
MENLGTTELIILLILVLVFVVGRKLPILFKSFKKNCIQGKEQKEEE